MVPPPFPVQHVRMDPNTLGELQGELLRRGYSRLGAGRNAVVFQHPKREGVVKIWRASDERYNMFLDFAMRHQNLANVPKILGGVQYYPNANAYSVRIEELSERTGPNPGYDQNMVYNDRFYRSDKDYPLAAALWRMQQVAPGWDVWASQNILQRDDGTWVFSDPW